MTEERYMRRCFELALRGAGKVAPNPMVGAVLVYDDRVIGEGYHQYFGGPHAEVNCLDTVADADKQLIPESTMYVSLEPCAHEGKTPSCALRLVKERVKKVLIANQDNFEKVNGAGVAILEAAGIDTTTGMLEKEGAWLNRRFFTFHRLKRPYIVLKWAESAEGFVAPLDLKRTQLSNAYSNHLVHRWRTEEAAIMVGYNTALHDNPQLTARDFPGNQPLRIALDRAGKLPKTHHLFNQETPTWIISEQTTSSEGYLQILKMNFDENLLPEILCRLYDAGKLSLIVEGGALLLQSFIDEGLWDEARIFKTPVVLGSGIPAPHLKNATLPSQVDVAGDDLQLWVNNTANYPYVTGGHY